MRRVTVFARITSILDEDYFGVRVADKVVSRNIDRSDNRLGAAAVSVISTEYIARKADE